MPDWSSSFCTGMEKETPSAILYFDSWVTLQKMLAPRCRQQINSYFERSSNQLKMHSVHVDRETREFLGIFSLRWHFTQRLTTDYLACCSQRTTYQVLNWPESVYTDCSVFCSVVKVVLCERKSRFYKNSAQSCLFSQRTGLIQHTRCCNSCFRWLLLASTFEVLSPSGTSKQTSTTTLPFRI